MVWFYEVKNFAGVWTPRLAHGAKPREVALRIVERVPA